MRKLGILLAGFSLLTLALVIVLLNLSDAMFFTAGFGSEETNYLPYFLIGIVFIFGIYLAFYNER
ncbi:hypothetical protein [Ornithinibacillus halotolerans]|uniref:Uncharacterized protein n=1 Tax=Ornithinibacillus halotolerans TaxID=1274357 RepID=A0A916S7D3_9BACI|nr:hypothetical protein [Ornithinibacillus halotolerans]GGA85184.1 hypothetical protein GCM10008025_30280 [Ornithinibacillus halotolerans]